MLKRLVLSCVSMLLALGIAPPAAAQDARRAFDIGEQQRKDGRYEEAQISFDAACRGGYAEGCFKLGNSWEHGWGNIAKAPMKAEQAYMRGCNLGQTKSCAGAAVTMDDRPETAAQALRYNTAACEEEAIRWACSNAGSAHMSGKGTSVNKDEARRFYATSCDLGSAVGCFWQAKLLQERGTTADLRRAEALYKRHCDDMNGQESCQRYGELVFNRATQESATRIPSDSALATTAKYYTTSCDRGRKEACRTAAQVSYLGYTRVRRNNGSANALRDAARKFVRAYAMADCGPSGCGYDTKQSYRWAKLDLVATDYQPQSDPCGVLGNITLSNGATADRNMLSRKAKCIGRYTDEEAKRLQSFFADTGVTVTVERENGKIAIRWRCPAQSGCSPKLEPVTERIFAKRRAMEQSMQNNLNRYSRIYDRNIEVSY